MDPSRALRKRAFDQGSGGINSSDIDVLEYSSEDSVDAVENMANLRRKGKEIMVQDVTALNNDGCLHMIEEGKLGGDYKGKGLLLYATSNDSDSDYKKAPFFMEQSSSSTSAAVDAVADGDYSENLAEQSSDTDQDDFDDYLEDLPKNGWYGTEEISYLQNQFEKTDIPPDIEVDIPWWSDPGHKNGASFNLSGTSTSSGNATQAMLDSGGKSGQTAVSLANKSTGGSILSTGIRYTNGSNSVPYKHGSLINKYAADSFAVAQTDSQDGSSGTMQPKSTKEAAMMRYQQFKKFAVVDDYSDHHYAKRSSDMQLEKASAKKIMDEWKILQSSLPDTIFVRVYESKMDLLRAVIIGAQGTPYHDGLFFFDVMFPSNYPSRPPHVHYYSGGLRLNPNLYETGKVCLSLLGTWPGRSFTENWIPGKSTLLQVLISIQALILNANPYFNEPGDSRFGVKNASNLYNEETLLNSLKTMTYSVKNPPKHFKEFVPDYFITRSRDILLVCNEYMKGAQVGSVSIVDGKVVKEKDTKCSGNFRDKIGCYLNSLIDEFAKLGVNDCDEFRVPASNIKEPKMAEAASERGHFTWSASGFNPMSSAKFKTSSSHSQFMSAPFPATPGVPYPIPQPSSPLSTMTSQLLFPHLVPYPFPPPQPHPIAMISSSSKPWNPSLSLSVHAAAADTPIRFVPPPLRSRRLQNVRPVVNPNLPTAFRSVPRRPWENAPPFVHPNPPARPRPSRPPMPNHPSKSFKAET